MPGRVSSHASAAAARHRQQQLMAAWDSALTSGVACRAGLLSVGACAAGACRDVLARLIPRLLGAPERTAGEADEGAEEGMQEEGSLLAGIAPEHVHGMMQDRTSSHLMEVRQLCVPGRP